MNNSFEREVGKKKIEKEREREKRTIESEKEREGEI